MGIGFFRQRGSRFQGAVATPNHENAFAAILLGIGQTIDNL